MSNVEKIYFSPSSTTKKVVEQIANNFSQEKRDLRFIEF